MKPDGRKRQHLSRILEFYPSTVAGLVLGDRHDIDVRIVDTAPKVLIAEGEVLASDLDAR